MSAAGTRRKMLHESCDSKATGAMLSQSLLTPATLQPLLLIQQVDTCHSGLFSWATFSGAQLISIPSSPRTLFFPSHSLKLFVWHEELDWQG